MARLLRPNGQIFKIEPKRGKVFSRPELFSLVGPDFEIIELMSGDYLLTEKDSEERNAFASKLAKKDVKGTAILVEPEEID